MKSRLGKEKSMSLQSKTALRGLLIALAMVFSWIEMQIPYPIPGAKLGLTNVVVLVALYRFGIKDAIAVNLIRIVLVGLTFGSMFSMLYSLAGGILSGGVMILMKELKVFRVVTVSLVGGILHNIGQILVAMAALETSAIASYLPVLWVSGMISGIVVGILGAVLIRRLPKLSGE